VSWTIPPFPPCFLFFLTFSGTRDVLSSHGVPIPTTSTPEPVRMYSFFFLSLLHSTSVHSSKSSTRCVCLHGDFMGVFSESVHGGSPVSFHDFFFLCLFMERLGYCSLVLPPLYNWFPYVAYQLSPQLISSCLRWVIFFSFEGDTFWVRSFCPQLWM